MEPVDHCSGGGQTMNLYPIMMNRKLGSGFESRGHDLLLGASDSKITCMFFPGSHGIHDLSQNRFRRRLLEPEVGSDLHGQIKAQRIVGFRDVEAQSGATGIRIQIILQFPCSFLEFLFRCASPGFSETGVFQLAAQNIVDTDPCEILLQSQHGQHLHELAQRSAG